MIFKQILNELKIFFLFCLPPGLAIGIVYEDSSDDQLFLAITAAFIFYGVSKLLISGIILGKTQWDKYSSDPRGKIEIRLTLRCTSLKVMNFLILAMIAGSTCVGMYIFVYAEDLARGDDSYRKAVEQVAETHASAEHSFTSIKNKITDIKASSKDSTNLIGDLEVKISEELVWLEKEYPIMLSALKKAEEAKANTLVFISTIANKVGSILILYFFINILVTLHRYNANSLTFYESKLMLVTLDTDIENKTSEQLAKIFNFSAIKFEPKDKAPTSELISTLKSTTQSFKDVAVKMAGTKKTQE